jgi:predicted metal-dependent phosphoesterase TrpH
VRMNNELPTLEANHPLLTRIKVERNKPYLDAIQQNGYMVVDMHVHTRFSDSFTRIHKLLKKADKLNIGLAITDHNEIQGVLRAYDLNTAVPIIPGIEVSTAEGPHILVYFFHLEDLVFFYLDHIHHRRSVDPHSNTSFKICDLINITKQFDCVVSVAHPFALAYTNVPNTIKKGFVDKSFLEHVDAVEVMNGAITKRKNRKAVEFAQALNKGITGGSDSHSLFELGKIVTYAKADNIQTFLRAVKQGHNFVIGQPIGRIRRVPSLAKSSQKHMAHFFPAIPQRYQIVAREVRYRKPMVVEKFNTIKNGGLDLLKKPLHARKTKGSIPEDGSD